MADNRRRTPGPLPPVPQGRGGRQTSFGGYKKQDASEFADHADEVRSLAGGRDFVERPSAEHEKRPAPFDRQELQVVRSWTKRRPLEPTAPASAMVDYPRMWSTKRGRYSKFKIPGAGAYGLLRSRPTW